MSNFENPESEKQQSGPELYTPAPPPADVENQATGTGTGTGYNISGVLRRWRMEELMRKGPLTLRAIALFFSLLSFIIMASNEHGGWKDYDKYEEYRYVLAMAILSTLYTGLQILNQLYQLRSGKYTIDQRTSAWVNFFGDQIMAYLLVSSASSAVPLTNRMREGADNIFTDSSAAAISMSFLAFLALALSALVSGYKLSTQSYI
ncbi:hypothetical protein Ancab_031504 [Ancistrocladus abbreviatus]